MRLSFILTKATLMHLGETKISNNTPQVYEKNPFLHSQSLVREEHFGTQKIYCSHFIFSEKPEEVKSDLDWVQHLSQWCSVDKWWEFSFIYIGRFPRLLHICTVQPPWAGSRAENMQHCGATSVAMNRAAADQTQHWLQQTPYLIREKP